MSTEIIVNATHQETRVALLENKLVTEIFIERAKDRGNTGNVYKGRVVKVLPGMQAAFVDIGLEKSAFLYVADVYNSMEEYAQMMAEDITEEDELELEDETRPRRRRPSSMTIEELLQEGQEIIVQVAKEPIGTKGARVTSYVTLPGRYVVYMPTVDHIGISRRIESETERKRLKDIVTSLKKNGAGYIVRTVSEGQDESELRRDMDFLELLWQRILKKNEKLSAPSVLHYDLDLVFRTIRDLFTPDVERLVIDSTTEYQRVKEFADSYLTQLNDKVELYDKEEPIFDAYDVEIEISRALGRKVWLKSGGYIVIDQSEALTAIDVNTGRYVGKRNLEDTILKTNLEAVREIAYQLKLRNIGGIIILDLIDMEKEENRRKVYTSLQEYLSHDKAKTNIYHLSDLGLIEMTRKRTRESLGRSLCEPCPYCEGRGFIKSSVTICYEIFREIRRISHSSKEKKIMVSVNPEVADLLYDEERQGVEDLELELKKKLIIKADTTLHQEQYDIVMV
ncbi:MAG: Rne/Rng family ribonuclease [Nitrospirota bacterium]